MTRRTTSWIVSMTVSVLLCGCGSGGIEQGIPSGVSGVDASKVPDPMAGVKLYDAKSKGKAGSNDPMKLKPLPAAK